MGKTEPLHSTEMLCSLSEHHNDQGKVGFLFLASIILIICIRHSPSIMVVMQELLPATYFILSFLTLFKQCGLLYLSVTSGSSLSSALHARSSATHCFDFVPQWLEPPQDVRLLLSWILNDIPLL